MGAEQLQIEPSPSPEPPPPEQMAAAAGALIRRRSGGLRHRFRSTRLGCKRRGHAGLIHPPGCFASKTRAINRQHGRSICPCSTRSPPLIHSGGAKLLPAGFTLLTNIWHFNPQTVPIGGRLVESEPPPDHQTTTSPTFFFF